MKMIINMLYDYQSWTRHVKLCQHQVHQNQKMKNPPDWSSSEFKLSVDMIVTEKSAVVVEAGN